jgi:hypothetical protein
MKPVVAKRLDTKKPDNPMETIVEEDWENEFTLEPETKRVNTLVDVKLKK